MLVIQCNIRTYMTRYLFLAQVIDRSARAATLSSHEDHMTEYEHIGSEIDQEAITSVREAHVAALNAGDAEAWVAQFTDDGVKISPNAPANVGRTMIRSWSQALLDHFSVRFALTVHEVRVLGEWAFERGDYTISLSSKAGGPTMQDIGKYITVYQ